MVRLSRSQHMRPRRGLLAADARLEVSLRHSTPLRGGGRCSRYRGRKIRLSHPAIHDDGRSLLRAPYGDQFLRVAEVVVQHGDTTGDSQPKAPAISLSVMGRCVPSAIRMAMSSSGIPAASRASSTGGMIRDRGVGRVVSSARTSTRSPRRRVLPAEGWRSVVEERP